MSLNETRLSYIPIIAPSTPERRMQMLCNIADSFVYVICQMEVTGKYGRLDVNLNRLIERVHAYTRSWVSTAIGFGISTREQFLEVSRLPDAVDVDSSIITILQDSAIETGAQDVKDYCLQVGGRTEGEIVITARKEQNHQLLSPTTVFIASNDGADDVSEDKDKVTAADSTNIHTRLGSFGGQYVPEALMVCLAELENGFTAAKADPGFWVEINSYVAYANRPSSLHLAPRLTAHTGGARIWLKREDLNHTGSHKINNALGQIILARRLGKTTIIAETATGQHGVVTATLCAQFGMKCTTFHGLPGRRATFSRCLSHAPTRRHGNTCRQCSWPGERHTPRCN